MDKVKSAMKLCKDVSESVEAALYKFCGSNLNSTWYKSWTKSFIENVADCRNKAFYYRVLTGMISVQKVVSLDGNNMRKPEYSSPLDETCSVNKSAEQGNDARVSSDGDVSTLDPIVSTRGIVKKESTSVATKASSSTSKCDNKSKRAPRRSDGVQKTVHTATSLSTLDSILGDGAKDTTEQHLSHFYDVNCSICLAKQKSQAEAERKEKEEKERQREEDRRYREMLPPIRPYEFTEHKSATLIDLDYSANSGRDSADEVRQYEFF
ncbi:hypothetical protein DICVIV_12721 [Dictyocaulus viviparus]|uniref:TFIIS central domain-containing protein n=1 Tax=Dictyocaulus viviparus TaxID=29172 RepID=A0A0D8X9P5_DICVI|nr:hypothetical protein DICVIV_12721 [Dictyocaulus viviparus]